MRHRKSGTKLNMSSSHRQAMFRNMVTSLLKHDRIKTTDTRAKELRSWADHLITLAKRGDLHSRRQALSIVREKDVVHKLFEEADKRFGKVNGGYTRITKIGRRPGDAALVSMIELISAEVKPKKKKAKPAAKKEAPVQKAASETESVEAAEDDVTTDKATVEDEPKETQIDKKVEAKTAESEEAESVVKDPADGEETSEDADDKKTD